MRKQVLHPRTAAINQKQKNQAKKARFQALQWLSTKFPQVFENSTCIQPLSIGIMNDILAYADEAMMVGISKSKLREAVVLFTRRVDYLTCLKAREMRVDLHGNAVELVSEEDAACAALKIKKRVEKCAKMTRKKMDVALATTTKRPAVSSDTKPLDRDVVYYQDRLPAFGMQNSSTLIAPVRSRVSVKHKTPRQFDPDAVARLKEKLGLSHHRETALSDAEEA